MYIYTHIIHTYMQTCIHTPTHTHTTTHTHPPTHIRSMFVLEKAMIMLLYTYMHVYMYTYITYTYIHTHPHRHIHACIYMLYKDENPHMQKLVFL
jgi:hypothetical protein